MSIKGRVKEDQYIIEQRKRMLQTFLNRLVRHPILGREHIIHRFLETGESWASIHFPNQQLLTTIALLIALM